ncbi:hypothetical protein, partial [Autumnicola edwardsiae]
MKKTSLVLILMFLISLQGLPQKDIEILWNSKEVGKNMVTEESVMAKEYTFPERIHDFQVDTVNNHITIQL